MKKYVVQGEAQLGGVIRPQGSKNEALAVLCATLLTPHTVTLSNIPRTTDIVTMISMLRCLGATVTDYGQNGKMDIQATNIDLKALKSGYFKRMCRNIRGCVLILGPLLGRFGKACLVRPGGDKIGRRRLDTHFHGFVGLNATCQYDEDGFMSVGSDDLIGSDILLEEASVTGTSNLIMAAVVARGRTTLYNAACEPSVQQLCKLMVKMGAKISGLGSNLLTIDGVESLAGASHVILPDMIEIASFIGLAALTRSQLIIKDVSWENLGLVPNGFRKLGLKIEKRGDDMYIPAHTSGYDVESFIDGSCMTISDAPWPGFPTDVISIIIVTATQARGSVHIHEKMFESRLNFSKTLVKMSANIQICDPHRALVVGKAFETPLRADSVNDVFCTDIRAGMAFLIAALSATGCSTLCNVEQIERGHENIVERLCAIGAKIDIV